MKSIALPLVIVLEVVILVTAYSFRLSIGASIAVGLFVVVAIVLFVTSDFFLDRWERWRGRDS